VKKSSELPEDEPDSSPYYTESIFLFFPSAFLTSYTCSLEDEEDEDSDC